MEIRTTKEIQELKLSNGWGDVINKDTKEWIAVEDITKRLENIHSAALVTHPELTLASIQRLINNLHILRQKTKEEKNGKKSL